MNNTYQRAWRGLETKSAGDNDNPLAMLEGAFKEHDRATKARLDDMERKLQVERDRYDQLATTLRRTGGGGSERAGPSAEEKAWNEFLRHGDAAMPEAERKDLTRSTDTAGGYLATTSFEREIIKNVVQFSPVRQAARVGQMTTSDILLPKRTGAPTGYWVGETEGRSETGATYGQARLTAREMACYVDVSQQLLEDAAVDVEAEVSMDLAEEFARLEGLAFVSGDGVAKPFGILSDTDIPTVNTGTAATIKDSNGQASGLIDAFYALAPIYRNRATWMMNGTTLASIRKLKDGQGQYIWAPGIASGQPETILGRPVIEAPDMPNEGAGTYPALIGDFVAGYRIMDRVGMSILRDPYTQATNGLVRFHARRRVAGDVVKPEAFRIVKCST